MDGLTGFFSDLFAPVSQFFGWIGAQVDALFDFLIEVIRQNAGWAGPIMGAITFGESMVIIGAFFPATVLMVFAGGLAAQGIVNPVELIAWCVAGAVLGDAVSYWIGRKLGPMAWRHPMLRAHRRIAARARLFFRRWGVASIYLCRFMGPVRAFVPLIAGITAMPHGRFQLANLGSAVIWVPVMLAPGYLAGMGLQLLEGVDHGVEYAVGGIALVIVLVLLVRGWLRARLKGAESET